MVALSGSMLRLHAAEGETFTGAAARSGTYKRPLLEVNGKRYELKASDKADASVAQMLARFSNSDTGTYVVKGTRAMVNRNDGIIIDSIAPVTTPLPNAGAAASATEAIQGHAPPVAAQTTPAVTSRAVTVGSDWYRVFDYDDLTTRNHSVVIPEGLKTVRGLLVNACHAGGDSRQDWTICEYYRQFMHLHGFAYVGCTGTAGSPNSVAKAPDTPAARHRGIFQAFEDSMQEIATASRHPELANAPYVGVGFSAGGGFAFYLMVFAPDKTIATVSYSAPYIFKRRLTSPPSAAVLNVPSICITGEWEHFNAPFAPDVDPSTGPARIDEVFLPYRPKGAEYAWLERQGLGHAYDENRQDVLGMAMLDAAVRARYPKDGDVTKGPVKLLPIDSSTGWIADNATWKSGLTKIYRASEFKGDFGHSSWLMNEDIAFIYRAYSTYDKPLTITSPGNCWPTVPALDPGASAPIVVDASNFSNWKTMAFYDGAERLAEITPGAATRFTATNLTAGYHVFSILATDYHGNVRTADPKMVVVRPPDKTPAFADAVTVVTTLPAQVGTNFKSNIDLSGAVGLKHVVSFNGGGFVVYDKATGKVIERLSQSEFWTKRVAAGHARDPEARYNDPKLIYDPLTDRWFATVAPQNISCLAVSTSGDPTKPWRGVILPLPTVDPGLTTGVDKNGLYVCAANGNPDSRQALDCLAIPIADATSADGPLLTHAQSFTKLPFMAYPAMDINPHKAPDAPAILLNNEFTGFAGSGKLYLSRITWSGNQASISEAQSIPLSRTYDTSRPECEQPGRAPKLRASSAVRTESIVVHGGSVFGCHAAKLDSKSHLGIVWYEVRIKDGALLQEGFIDDPRCDYLYPSLAVDRVGNLGIGCSRVSQTEYPSIYVMMRAATDPPDTMRPPVLVVPGTTAYAWGGGNPAWCHYSSTCIDPSEPDLLWTCQPFSAGRVDKEWCTTWVAFKLSTAALSVLDKDT